MKISFERTGGFAGIRLFVSHDTADLEAEAAKELEDMIAGVDFFNLPANSPASGGADYNNYRITVEDGDKTHTVKATDMSLPDGVGPLIAHLTKMALGR